MKKTLFYLLIAAILIAVFGGIAFKLRTNKAISEERVYHYDPASTAPKTDSETASSTSKKDEGILTFTGVFEPNRETKISTEVQGKINQITVDAGSTVSKGQVLIQLDDALLRLQLQTVDVQIEGLTADVNRYNILAKADAVQAVQLEKAELGLKSAKVQRATILEQLAKTAIKSPFNGVIFAKMNEVGGFAAPGTPLLHILDIETLKFTVNVSEGDLKYFKIGQSHKIMAGAFPGKILTGKVSMIASKTNPGNSFPIQFTVNNFSNYALKAGMFGQIELSTQN